MAFKVIVYEADGSKRTSLATKRPKTIYVSKEELLTKELSLNLSKIDNTYYLTNLKGEKLIEVYSKSATNIIKGLKKLKSEKTIKLETVEDKKKFRRVINGLKLKQCPHCLSGFRPKSNSQKYCCKDCSKKARQDKDAERKRKFRKESNIPPIGTINMGQHRKKDFNEEYEFIHKTMLNTIKK